MTDIPLRAPDQVMRLRRLGSLHQSRLSFMRVLLRRMARDGWRVRRTVFDVDAGGVGHAVYSVTTPERSYALVAFAHDLPDALRSDRVIAEAWDATFALFDGAPTDADIARLRDNVPRQEAGRVSARELTLSRANRSVRLWSHVVERLAAGAQPDPAALGEVGYLMRTTAVYGSGKFGAADRDEIADRPEMQAPFQAEMLTVYLIRTFVRDLVNHMARATGGDAAAELDPTLAQRLGIGNSTGLGMAPFLINHPVLFNNWITARETALARVRAVATITARDAAFFRDLVARGTLGVAAGHSAHPAQIDKLAALRTDIDRLADLLDRDGLAPERPWDALHRWAEGALSEEGQEWLVSLMFELHPDLVDDLAEQMADRNTGATRIDGAMPVGQVRRLIESSFGWALDLDWSDPAMQARAWYVSQEKLEPRLGERASEPIAPYEQPLAPARDAESAHRALRDWDADAPVAEFLLAHPEHRHTVRRAQMHRIAPYGEIHDNTISADLLPIDMLRAKLSFFGATQFDPRSDRWVRISLFQGEDYPLD